MEEILKDILNKAVYAPSGDNLQPWEFRLGADFIKIYNRPKIDTSLYNYSQYASFVAHGALIENILRIAEAKSFQAKIDLFPDKNNTDHVATIILASSNTKKNPDISLIEKRFTDRFSYQTKTIENETAQKLSSEVNKYQVSCTILPQNTQFRATMNLFARGDALIIQNKKIHDFFYDNLRWTKADLSVKQNGMDIDSITASIIDVQILKLLKDWKWAILLKKIGMDKFAVLKRQMIYQKSGGLVYFVVDSENPPAYLETGRALQALWLRATALGVSLQPVSSILFLYHLISKQRTAEFDSAQTELIKKTGEGIYQLLSVKKGIISFAARIGYTKNNANNLLRVRQLPRILH